MSFKPSVLYLAVLLLMLAGCSHRPEYVSLEGFAQGGTYHIRYSSEDRNGSPVAISSEEMAHKISETLKAIDFSVSGYNRSSILSRVNAGEDCPLDTHFIRIYEISRGIWEETGGYFDPTGAVLYDFWGFGFKDPARMEEIRRNADTPHVVDSLLQYVGMEKTRIENGRLVKDCAGIKLNFNAVAQGYTCDAVAAVLEEHGIRDYLVEVGMEIRCSGKNPKGKDWSIGIDTPIDGSNIAGQHISKVVPVTDCGIVTSGNYRKFYLVDGKKYAHTIDPHTGYPVSHDLLSATVIAADAATADAYATYCMVIGKEKAAAFIRSRSDLKGYLICEDESVDLL